MKHFLKIVSLVTAILLTGCATTQSGCPPMADGEDNPNAPLRVAIDPTYPPFTYKTSAGQPTGFDIDIAKALCAEMQRNCVFVEQEWERMIPALQARKFDVVISSMQITEDRRQCIDFTHPYQHIPSTLVLRRDIANTYTHSLKGKRIGVLQGGTELAYAKAELAPAGAEVLPFPNQDQIYAALAGGELDGMVGEVISIRDGLLRQAWGRNFTKVGPPLYASQYFGVGAGIAMRKGNPALLEEFNAAIQNIRTSGAYKAANDRYFDFDAYGQ